jgi:hypothetical protein
MEEARRLLARLDRVEALQREGAAPTRLLAELDALVEEAEAWISAERDVADPVVDIVRRCREMIEGASRTLLA